MRLERLKAKILCLSDSNAESALAHWLQAMQSPSARSEADSRCIWGTLVVRFSTCADSLVIEHS